MAMDASNRQRAVLDALVAEIAVCMPARWREANFSIVYSGDRMTCVLQNPARGGRARPSTYLITLVDELRRRMALAGDDWDSAWFELSAIGDSITYWSAFDRCHKPQLTSIEQPIPA